MSGDFLAGAGVLASAGAAALAILALPSRLRSGAMIAAALLAPVLVLGDQWDSSLITDLRDSPARLLALTAAAAAVVSILLVLFRRWPLLLPLSVVAALPFRIPLHAGGDQANLLVPLYLVIAAGVAAAAARDWNRRPAALRGAWLPRLLAAFVLLYGLASLYSEDFSGALQNACFFLAPFALVFALLADVRWDRRLLSLTLAVVAVEGVAFALVGFVEFGSRELFWNNAVIRSNEFHVYFRVNSLFWDPNVYGRYLAIAIVLAVGALLWARERRSALLLAAFALLAWLGLATTYSQSSFAALLGGLAVLGALRWSLRRTLLASLGLALVGVAVALAAGSSVNLDLSTDNKVNKETTGRFNLVTGGLELFADRPLWGYGSGSFPTAYRKHVERKPPVSESHTEPVTIAAEQGIVGLAVYLALIACALATLCRGFRDEMPGLRRGGPRAPPIESTAARATVFAALVALLVHTMAYAGFFEDPITWVLLAAGSSLAAAPLPRQAH